MTRSTTPRARPASGPVPRSGMAFAAGAYLMWGFLPVYFVLLAPAGAFEIVAWRVIFSLVFCAILIVVTRAWRTFRAVLASRRTVLIMGLAGALIYVNWQTYVLGVVTGHVVEAALGYFINPVVTVLLGVLVQQERLRPAQWTAVGISVAAILVISVGYGHVPWIALILAFSFGSYGLVKKRVADRVDAVSGLTLETVWLTPVAVVQLIVVGALGGLVFGTAGTVNTLLMLGTGIVTAVPLLLFAAASRRLPLVWVGFFQYITPIIQFLVGVLMLHETMPLERWLGFALVWVALIVLSADMVRSARRHRGPGGEPGADAGVPTGETILPE